MIKSLKNNKGNICMAARLGNFIIFLILTIITLGLYPLFFFVTRQQETVSLLTEIRDELKRP
jgi:NADH:ubiquinone oxidoreductase subunit 4 (subunit M)